MLLLLKSFLLMMIMLLLSHFCQSLVHVSINCRSSVLLMKPAGVRLYNSTPLIIRALLLITLLLGSTSQTAAVAEAAIHPVTIERNGHNQLPPSQANYAKYKNSGDAPLTELLNGKHILKFYYDKAEQDNCGINGSSGNYYSTNEKHQQPTWQWSPLLFPPFQSGFVPNLPTPSDEYYWSNDNSNYGPKSNLASDRIDASSVSSGYSQQNSPQTNRQNANAAWFSRFHDDVLSNNKNYVKAVARTHVIRDDEGMEKDFQSYYNVKESSGEEQRYEQQQLPYEYKFFLSNNTHKRQIHDQLQNQQQNYFGNEPLMTKVYEEEPFNVDSDTVTTNRNKHRPAAPNYETRDLHSQYMHNYLTRESPLHHKREEHKIKSPYNGLLTANENSHSNYNNHRNTYPYTKQKRKRNGIHDEIESAGNTAVHYDYPEVESHLDALTQIRELAHLQDQLNQQQHKFVQLQTQLNAHDQQWHVQQQIQQQQAKDNHPHIALAPIEVISPQSHNNLRRLVEHPVLAKHTELVKTVPVVQHHQVHVPYKQPIEIEIPEATITAEKRPVPIEIPIVKTVAVPIVKDISIPVERVRVVPVEKPVPYMVEKRVPYAVEKEVAEPVYYDVPYEVPVVHTVIHKHHKSPVLRHHHIQRPFHLPVRVYRHHHH